MQDFSKIILLQTFINRAKSQRWLKTVQEKLDIFQKLTPLPLTINGYVYSECAISNNEMTSCIDVMVKNNYMFLFFITSITRML